MGIPQETGLQTKTGRCLSDTEQCLIHWLFCHNLGCCCAFSFSHMQKAAPIFFSLCWPLFEMKAKENCRKPQWESQESVSFHVLHGLYLIERPFVSLKYCHQSLFSRRNDFSKEAKHYWKYLLFQFSYFAARHFCCSFLFSANLWKMSNIPDFDFIVEYVLPSFLVVPYQCLERLALYMN